MTNKWVLCPFELHVANQVNGQGCMPGALGDCRHHLSSANFFFVSSSLIPCSLISLNIMPQWGGQARRNFCKNYILIRKLERARNSDSIQLLFWMGKSLSSPFQAAKGWTVLYYVGYHSITSLGMIDQVLGLQ